MKLYILTRRLVLTLLTISLDVSADSLQLITGEDRGESNYYVHNTDPLNFLESKLVFPIQSNWIGLEYQKEFDDFSLSIGAITQIKNEQKTPNGEDFDWQNGIPTVYSFSENIITKNQTLYCKISKEINIDVINNIAMTMSWKNLDFKWQNTYQENYTNGTAIFVSGDTLTYSQEILKIGLTLFSNKPDSHFLYSGMVNYYDIDSTDHHLLRDLATTMSNKGIGYEFSAGYRYDIFSNGSIKFMMKYEQFEDSGMMKYYDHGLYAGSYPSKIDYNVFTPSLVFEYKF